MKKLKKLLVVIACLGLLVNVESYGNIADEPIQTWGILDPDVAVR